jgi:hypothetical protein
MFVTIFHYLKAVIAFYTATRKLWGAISAYYIREDAPWDTYKMHHMHDAYIYCMFL